MHAPRVWVLPGMGADSRIFRSIKFPWPATFLEWISPEPDESLESYADRMLSGHDIQSNDLLFGYSFGGIVAQEWASKNEVQRVVLLNSLHHEAKVRPLFKRLANTKVLDWAPQGYIRNLIFFMARLNSKPSRHLDLILEVMEQFDCDYYRWVLKQVLNWSQSKPSCPVDFIQGEFDPVFPTFHQEDPRTWILKGATHLSFQTHGSEISALLKEKVDPVLL
jgi:pimeloyl-ACP methyl ester carboxylesterase